MRCIDGAKRWTKLGTVAEVRRHGGGKAWSYLVLGDDGRTSLKSRQEIRIRRSHIQDMIGGIPIA